MIQNQAGQGPFGAQMINATTGAAYVGTVTCYVKTGTAAQSIGATGAGLCTSEGNGLYTYAPTAAETNASTVFLTFIGSGAVDVTKEYATVTAAQMGAIATATGLLAVPVSRIISDALAKLNIYGAGETPSPEDQDYVLGELNQIFDNWNADRAAVYGDVLSSYTWVPDLSPHTIGPTGTFTCTSRPQTISWINWVSSDFQTPIRIQTDPKWYESLANPTMSGVPTDVYYDPAWPNGNLYFWPVPSSATAIVMLSRVVLGQVLATDIFSMPPGYRSAVTLTLCENISPAFPNAIASPLISKQASDARARIFANNTLIPRLATQDAGMPGGRRTGASYDYRVGGWR